MNKIGEKGAEKLSFALSKLKNLNSLSLDIFLNWIEERGGLSLSSALSQLKNLQSLQL